MTPIRTIMDDVVAIATELGLEHEANEPYAELVDRILKLATAHISDLREKVHDSSTCDFCGEETKHHHCDRCFSDPRELLEEVMKILEEPVRDDTDRRYQREMLERVFEKEFGRAPRKVPA